MNQHFPYSIVEKLSFIRYGGTEEELKAAEILQEEIKSIGGSSELMNFQVPFAKIRKASICVPEEYREDGTLPEKIETIPYGLSGNLPEGGVDLKLYYADRGKEEDYIGMEDLSEYIVLINDLDMDAYKLLVKKHAAAFMTIHGKHFDTLHSSSLYERNLRPAFLEKGVVPGFMILAKDAIELVRRNVKTLHAELEEAEESHTSRNVLAVIEGRETGKEDIVLTAHYDSVPVGTGSWDNATGSAALMYIYRYFLEHQPRRTMRFVWCGSEEQGLLGSKAYVEAYPELIEKIGFCFNFDMCGTVLGPNMIFVTGGEKLSNFVELFCREYGVSSNLRTGVHSSDSAPFADKGIPALGLSRGWKGGEIHTWNDTIVTVSEEELLKNSMFYTAMIERVVNSVSLPVGKGMNEEMLKELDKYFRREKEEKK